MKNSLIKAIFTVLLALILIVTAVFLLGRYGWRLLGFSACESAGIESVEVTEDGVRIVGFCPGSFPEGFCGYHAREQGGTLYVGFRFSGLFGMFETGDFDITVPTEGDIHQVVIKTKNNEYPVWPVEEDSQDAYYGKMVLELYTLDEDGEAVQLFAG